MSKVALVVGVTGQDGAYLARLLLRKGYVVHGTSRDAGWAHHEGLKALGLQEQVQLHSLATSDFRSMATLIERLQPSHIYNLSGLSSVGLSFDQPIETMESIVVATINLLESLRLVKSDARFYNAGSSEMFGDTTGAAADENAAVQPKSPYGIAKAAAVSLVKNYREFLRVVCLLRNPVQSRVAAATAAVRDAQDDECGGAHRPRGTLSTPTGKPLAAAGLRLGAGLCRSHARHVEFRPAGGSGDCDGRTAFARRVRLGSLRGSRGWIGGITWTSIRRCAGRAISA